jgi:hypothetical protein
VREFRLARQKLSYLGRVRVHGASA